MLKNSKLLLFVLVLIAPGIVKASAENEKIKEEAQKIYGDSAKRAYLAYHAAYDQCNKSNYNTRDDCKKFARAFIRTQNFK